jgi:TonB family protein
MLHTFVSSSRPRHGWSLGMFGISAVIHAAFVALAFSGTPAGVTSVPRAAGEQVRFVDLPYTPSAGPGATRRAIARASAAEPSLLARARDVRRTLSTRPQVSQAGTAMPSAPLALRGAAAPVGGGIIQLAARVLKQIDDADADSVNYIAATVDTGAVPKPDNPKPRYPDELRRRAVEAQFSVYFVVDTTGRVDRSSIDVPPAVHYQFAREVTYVLSRWHFFPAQRHGRRVRQLMEQAFVFRIIAPRT